MATQDHEGVSSFRLGGWIAEGSLWRRCAGHGFPAGLGMFDAGVSFC